ESSVSLWEATTEPLRFPPLKGDSRADVCVVGGGIAGVTTAYLLARQGKRVTLLERSVIGGGETGQTTAHLASELDDYYHVIEKMHGEEGARVARESHQSAIERVAQIASDEEIACDLERCDGYLVAATPEHEELLEKEVEA